MMPVTSDVNAKAAMADAAMAVVARLLRRLPITALPGCSTSTESAIEMAADSSHAETYTHAWHKMCEQIPGNERMPRWWPSTQCPSSTYLIVSECRAVEEHGVDAHCPAHGND